MSALTIDNLSEHIVKRIQANPENMERLRLVITETFPDTDLLEKKDISEPKKKYSMSEFLEALQSGKFGPPMPDEEIKAWHEEIEAARDEWDTPR
jgi:hypothetical protein